MTPQESRRAQFAKEPTHFIEVWKSKDGKTITEPIKWMKDLKLFLDWTAKDNGTTLAIFFVHPRITKH